jgi:hypothetical protein
MTRRSHLRPKTRTSLLRPRRRRASAPPRRRSRSRLSRTHRADGLPVGRCVGFGFRKKVLRIYAERISGHVGCLGWVCIVPGVLRIYAEHVARVARGWCGLLRPLLALVGAGDRLPAFSHTRHRLFGAGSAGGGASAGGEAEGRKACGGCKWARARQCPGPGVRSVGGG